MLPLCILFDTPGSSAAWLVSKPYCLAMGLAVLEYLVEIWLFSSLKIQAGNLRPQQALLVAHHQLGTFHSLLFCAGCDSYWGGDGGDWRGHQEGCHGWFWLPELVVPEGGLHSWCLVSYR